MLKTSCDKLVKKNFKSRKLNFLLRQHSTIHQKRKRGYYITVGPVWSVSKRPLQNCAFFKEPKTFTLKLKKDKLTLTKGHCPLTIQSNSEAGER